MAICFALYASRLKQRVLLVDMNVRQPAIAAALGEPKSDSFDIRAIKELNIDYLPPLKPGSDPVAIIGTDNFSNLMTQISKEYDCVVIDSAPATTATETRLLASMADSIILVVKWGNTNAETARSAIHSLRAFGSGTPISVVINQANMRVHVRHRHDQPGAPHATLQAQQA